MITVNPGQTFEFKSPNTTTLDRERLIRELTDIINKSAPYLEGITIHNSTKSVKVELAMEKHVLHIRLTNPKDETFDVNGDL